MASTVRSTLEARLPVELVAMRDGRNLALHTRDAKQGRHAATLDVVLVHGSCASMLQWSAQIDALAERHNVVAYDAYGCGRSPKPNDWHAYSAAQHVEDLKAVVRRCNEDGRRRRRRTVIVAHSAACSWALQAALDEPVAIDGLVLLGGLDAKPEAASHVVFRFPVRCLEGIQPLLSAGFEERALHPRTRAGASQEHRDLMDLCAETNRSNPMYMCKAYYRQFEVVPLESLARIAVPTLLLVGEADGLAPPLCSERLCRALGAACGARVVVVAETSHQLMQESPGEVNANLLAFLAERV